jgi:hypothetical protein
MTDQTEDPTPVSAGVIPGSGIDEPASRRPGVPMERWPSPAGHAHWDEPDRQDDPGHVLRRKGLARLTPVFGSTLPPRGISGMMRRAAYDIPEHHTSHWLVLLLADRVDALEYRLKRISPFAIPAVLAGAAFVAFVRFRNR